MMPPNPTETEPMRRSRKAILQLVETINNCATLLARLAAEIVLIRQDLLALTQQHPEFAHANQRELAEYFVYRLSLFCIYALDVMLIGGFAEFCARALFPHWPFIGTVARFLTPLAVLGFELGVAAQRHAAQIEAEEALPGAPRSYAVTWWTVLGVAWALVVPAITWYTQHAAASLKLATSMVLARLGPVLMVIAFILHLAVLFAGKFAHDAKGHIAYWLKTNKLGRREAKNSAQARTKREIFQRAVVHYVHALDHHNTMYPGHEITPGPFTEETKSLAVQVFGSPVPRYIANHLLRPERGVDSP